MSNIRRALMAAAGAAGDTCFSPGNDANTEFLVHSDTTDGSTTFTDSSSNGLTITANGDVQHDTAQNVLSQSSSILFDGTGDYLSTPYDSNTVIGTSDFCIDFHVRFNVSPATKAQTFAANYDAGSEANKAWYFAANTGTTIRWAQADGVSTSNISMDYTWSADTWYHVAMTRDSGNLRFFVDGVQQDSTDTSNMNINDPSRGLEVGIVSGFDPLDGWMSEIRFSVGASRWSSNFTPPATPFCDAS